MTATLPDGFRFRHAVDADVEVAAAIIAAEERAVRGRSTWGVEETSGWWDMSDLADGTWIVETTEGAPAGFGASVDPWSTFWASVHPDFTGKGIAAALIRRAEARSRERGAAFLRTGAFSENAAAFALLHQLGYREVRRFYRMQIDLDRAPEPPRLPAEITIAPFRIEDARVFHTVLDEAFADGWGHVPISFEEWRRIRVDAPGVDHSLWFVARDGADVAGVARCEPKKHGGGWIEALGVRRQSRRRGVGLALLRHAFQEFQRRGEPHVGLGVDTENPTGATRLYERAGMRVMSEDVVFEKALA
jgi:mycothiol synthase